MDSVLGHMPSDAVRFFKLVAESVYIDQHKQCGKPSHPWPSGFEKCKTDFERVQAAMSLSLLKNFKISKDIKRCALKCDELSRKHREMGNQLWFQKRINDALQYYNLALFTAGSEESKALAYGNRSCVLAHLGANIEVIQDIDRALEHGFPSDRRPKLLLRRAQALAKLGQIKDAAKEYKNLITLNDSNQICRDESLAKLLENGLKDCFDSVVDQKDLTPPSFIFHSTTVPINSDTKEHDNPEIHDRLQLALGFKSAVKLEYVDEKLGWNLVVTRDVKPGELLILDKPYSCRIHGDHLYSNCYRCFGRCINLIPCRNCSQVGFCSLECEQAAWLPEWSLNPKERLSPDLDLPSHRLECGRIHFLRLGDYAGWKIFRNYNSSQLETDELKHYKTLVESISESQCIGGPISTWLSFACFARTPPWTINKLVRASLGKYEGQKPESEQKPSLGLLSFTEERVVPPKGSDDYCLISWLISNSDKRTVADLWQRTVAALYLVYCLDLMGYPINWEDPVHTDDMDINVVPASWAAACILHHIQCVSSNAHSYSCSKYIQPVVSKKPHKTGVNLELFQIDSIGSCLYPALSLANHSCDPNVFHVYMPNAYCGLFALRPLKTGDSILDNYGYQFAIHPLKVRRSELLSQYCFLCKCEACQNKWPLVSSPDPVPVRIRCSVCHRFFILGLDTSQPNDSIQCHCSPDHRAPTLQKYIRLVDDLKRAHSSIPPKFMAMQYDQIDSKFLDRYINYATKMMTCIGDIISGPDVMLQWLQEFLKQIMDLRHGCFSIELDSMKSHSPLS